jgi:Ca2+-binding RTX toxin-like protein
VRVADQHGLSTETDITITLGNRDPESIVGTAGDDVFHGGRMNDRLSGGGGNDRLVGNAGRDTLSGDSGNDTLFGGAGKDTLAGGKGKGSRDAFVFDVKVTKETAKANADKIKDFGGKYDSIFFDDAAFSNKMLSKLGQKASLDKPAKLKKYVAFGGKAKDKNDFFLVDTKKKQILFDADGSGSKAKAVLVATYAEVKNEGKIAAAYFFLI